MLSPRMSSTRAAPGPGSSSSRHTASHSRQKIRSFSIWKISALRYQGVGRVRSSCSVLICSPGMSNRKVPRVRRLRVLGVFRVEFPSIAVTAMHRMDYRPRRERITDAGDRSDAGVLQFRFAGQQRVVELIAGLAHADDDERAAGETFFLAAVNV